MDIVGESRTKEMSKYIGRRVVLNDDADQAS